MVHAFICLSGEFHGAKVVWYDSSRGGRAVYGVFLCREFEFGFRSI